MKGKELVGVGTALGRRQRGRWPKPRGVYATLAGRLQVFERVPSRLKEREAHSHPRAIQLDRRNDFDDF